MGKRRQVQVFHSFFPEQAPVGTGDLYLVASGKTEGGETFECELAIPAGVVSEIRLERDLPETDLFPLAETDPEYLDEIVEASRSHT